MKDVYSTTIYQAFKIIFDPWFFSMPWEIQQIYTFLRFWKLVFVCVVFFLMRLFVVTTIILFSGRSHVLLIMHLILSRTNYVRILKFTFQTILFNSNKDVIIINIGFRKWIYVGFRKSVQKKSLPFRFRNIVIV